MSKPLHGFEIKTKDGEKYYGNDEKKIYPIHRCPEDLKQRLKEITHHYCDMFTEHVLEPLPEKVFVENTEYEVNKFHRVLISSYDKKLNLWQCAPTFKSEINYIAGTPILDSAGKVVSIITGSKDNFYAISCFDGSSGKFETQRDWITINGSAGFIYGNRTFSSREELREYLKGRKIGNNIDQQAIVINATVPRIVLFDLISGLEISHTYIRGNFTSSVCHKYH